MGHDVSFLDPRSLKHCQHHQQRLSNASQLLASGSIPYNGGKCSNFLLQQQKNDTLDRGSSQVRRGRLAPVSRIEKSDFLSITGGGMANSHGIQEDILDFRS
ncbi:hypothetical protein IFM89_020102 [Coptis chinensis]|uniref:Uncharacterized protein n=1 Tax=Coptis chinensis TaxID=261450 RepID=A0A835LJ82_9MAGN|nr:hypothetical protein IFM89_020102 [Coptis chinensis]